LAAGVAATGGSRRRCRSRALPSPAAPCAVALGWRRRHTGLPSPLPFAEAERHHRGGRGVPLSLSPLPFVFLPSRRHDAAGMMPRIIHFFP